MPDLYDLLYDGEAEKAMKARAIAAALRGQRMTGDALSASDGSALGSLGKSMSAEAGQGLGELDRVPEQNAKVGLERERLVTEQGERGRKAGPVSSLGSALLTKLGLGGLPDVTAGDAERYAPLLEKFAVGKMGADARAKAAGTEAMLTPGALTNEAALHNAGQPLPALGMGKHGGSERIRVANRAAELNPGGNLAGAKASYHADSASLSQLQRQTDAVEAFEKTAGANMDRAVGAIGKLVDTGSPLLNRPARWLAANAGGSADAAAAHAALVTAMTEVSKVLTGGTGVGAVSDSARQEAQSLIGPEMTMAQVVAAADILRKDMATRKQMYRGQIEEIRKRASGGSALAEPKSEAEYKALPSGTHYLFKGKEMVKP